MPLEFREDEACLSGVSVAEEALTLAEWLAAHPTAKVDLAACTHIHTSLLQTLLAYDPPISAQPTDEFLTRWIIPMLAVRDSAVRDSAEAPASV